MSGSPRQPQQQSHLFTGSVLTLSRPFFEPLPSLSMRSSQAVLWILPGTERLQHPRGRRSRTLTVQPNGQERLSDRKGLRIARH